MKQTLKHDIGWYPNKATMILEICGKLNIPYIPELHKCNHIGITKLYDAFVLSQSGALKKEGGK